MINYIKNKISSGLYLSVFVLYIFVGIVQMVAAFGGLSRVVGKFFAFILIWLFNLPIVGTIAGVYYSINKWNWNPILAILFFTFPFILWIILPLIATLIDTISNKFRKSNLSENKQKGNKKIMIEKNIKVANKHLIIFGVLYAIIESVLYAFNPVGSNTVGITVLFQYLVSKVIIVNKIKKEKTDNVVSYTWKISLFVLLIRWLLGIIIGIIIATNYSDIKPVKNTNVLKNIHKYNLENIGEVYAFINAPKFFYNLCKKEGYILKNVQSNYYKLYSNEIVEFENKLKNLNIKKSELEFYVNSYLENEGKNIFKKIKREGIELAMSKQLGIPKKKLIWKNEWNTLLNKISNRDVCRVIDDGAFYMKKDYNKINYLRNLQFY